MSSLWELTLYEYHTLCRHFQEANGFCNVFCCLFPPGLGSVSRRKVEGSLLQQHCWLPAKLAYPVRNWPSGIGADLKIADLKNLCQHLGKQKLFTKIVGEGGQGLLHLDQIRGIYWRSWTRQRKEKGKEMKCLVNVVPWGLSKMEWTKVWGTAIVWFPYWSLPVLKDKSYTWIVGKMWVFLCAWHFFFKRQA